MQQHFLRFWETDYTRNKKEQAYMSNYHRSFMFALGAILFAATYLFVSKDSSMNLPLEPPFKTIELPPEITAITNNKNLPDVMQGYKSNDTLYIRFAK